MLDKIGGKDWALNIVKSVLVETLTKYSTEMLQDSLLGSRNLKVDQHSLW